MHAPRSRCGILLAGGASIRFGGTPKGLVPLGALRLADYPLQALAAVCDDVIIAANDPAASEWFPLHRVVRDQTPGLGALGALVTALLAAGDRTTVVCAWDMPFVKSELLEALATAVERGASCCIPQHTDGQLEPLCAAYAASCATLSSTLLASGERAAHALAAACGGERWPIPASAPDSGESHSFFNVNTPADLALAAGRLARNLNHP
jgi:molybdopterin-guanine dinucleotide biosynthesis protein A